MNVLFASLLVETIHVELHSESTYLPHERLIFFVFEVLGQDFVCEGVKFFDNKSILFLLPRDGVSEFFTLGMDLCTWSI